MNFAKTTISAVSKLAVWTLLGLLAACQQREYLTYYPTGELALRAPLDSQGFYEGDVIRYYKTGAIKAVMPFRHHRINGLVKRYYPTGALQSTEVCKNGETDGVIEQFYPTQQLAYRALRHGATYVDTAHYYWPNGRLRQAIVYDATGHKIDFAVYRADGEVDRSYSSPLFLSDRDTLLLGENYKFELRLGNRLSGVITTRILGPAKGLDSTAGTYASKAYMYRAPRVGLHTITAVIREEWSRKRSDTVWTELYQVSHSFLVVEKAK